MACTSDSEKVISCMTGLPQLRLSLQAQLMGVPVLDNCAMRPRVEYNQVARHFVGFPFRGDLGCGVTCETPPLALPGVVRVQRPTCLLAPTDEALAQGEVLR